VRGIVRNEESLEDDRAVHTLLKHLGEPSVYLVGDTYLDGIDRHSQRLCRCLSLLPLHDVSRMRGVETTANFAALGIVSLNSSRRLELSSPEKSDVPVMLPRAGEASDKPLANRIRRVPHDDRERCRDLLGRSRCRRTLTDNEVDSE
jgi:hypothetical protein